MFKEVLYVFVKSTLLLKIEYFIESLCPCVVGKIGQTICPERYNGYYLGCYEMPSQFMIWQI